MGSSGASALRDWVRSGSGVDGGGLVVWDAVRSRIIKGGSRAVLKGQECGDVSMEKLGAIIRGEHAMESEIDGPERLKVSHEEEERASEGTTEEMSETIETASKEIFGNRHSDRGEAQNHGGHKHDERKIFETDLEHKICEKT